MTVSLDLAGGRVDGERSSIALITVGYQHY